MTDPELETWLQLAPAAVTPEIKQVIGYLISRVADVDTIIAATCASFGVSVAEVLGKDRHPTIVRARKSCFAALRYVGLSFPEIGKLMGRNHTTVLQGVRSLELRKSTG